MEKKASELTTRTKHRVATGLIVECTLHHYGYHYSVMLIMLDGEMDHGRPSHHRGDRRVTAT